MAKTAIQLITSALAKQYKLSAADASAFVDTFFSLISSELKNGNQVKVKGLGTFKVQAVKSRESVNVNTGERVLIKGHDKISFTPDAVMKELVNKPFSQFETVVINDGVSTEELERIPAEEKAEETNTEQPEELSTQNTNTEKKETTIKKETEQIVQTADNHIITEDAEPIKDEVQTIIEEETKESSQPSDTNEILDSAKEVVESMENDQHLQNNENEDLTEETLDTDEKTTNEVEEKPKQASSTLSNNPDKQPKSSSQKVMEEKVTPDVSKVSNTSDDTYIDVNGSENSVLKKVVWFALIIITGLVVFLWIRIGNTDTQNDAKNISEQIKTPNDTVTLGTKTVSADTTSQTAKPTKSFESEETTDDNSFSAMNKDARIRYGAYNIIGIDRVVVLKKGETMEKYSRKTLGADMVGYFQVLNGCNTMQEGDTMKVPKVELRPEYRK